MEPHTDASVAEIIYKKIINICKSDFINNLRATGENMCFLIHPLLKFCKQQL